MPHITAENAADMARRSWESRRIAQAEKAKADAEEAARLQQIPQTYTDKRIARVRAQIDMLSDMLESEEDPNKLDRLANAISRMSELERQYSGRPLPGSLKPSSKPTRPQHTLVDPKPIDAPQQVVVPPTELSA